MDQAKIVICPYSNVYREPHVTKIFNITILESLVVPCHEF
jgi:hypothetical protein